MLHKVTGLRPLAIAIHLEALYRSDTVWPKGTSRADVVNDIVCSELSMLIRAKQIIEKATLVLEAQAFQQSGQKYN